MAAKRVPLGFTLEQHQQVASRLRNVWELVYRDGGDKTKPRLCSKLFDLVLKLAYEMAEYVYLDLKGTSYNPTRDDLYDGWRFSEGDHRYSFGDAKADLLVFRSILAPQNSESDAAKIVESMMSAMVKAGV